MAKLTYVDGEYRASGMFSHPNEAAACIILLVPLILGLIEEKRLPWPILVVALASAFAIFQITQSRGPLINAVLVFVVWATLAAVRVRNRYAPILYMICGLAVVGAAALYLTGDAGSAITRRMFDAGVAVNASERSDTILRSRSSWRCKIHLDWAPTIKSGCRL